MALDEQQVRNIAELAKLNINDEQMSEFQSDLGKILAMFEQLTNIDTSDVKPLTNPLDATQRLRSDQVTANDQREHLQKNAPLADQGYYLVPRVVE